MSQRTSTGFWTRVRPKIPLICTVVPALAFLKASDPTQAAFFGMAALTAFVWMIRRAKRVNHSRGGLGEPMFHLGNLTANAPTHMSGWYKLAVVAFAAMGFTNFFITEDASLPQRLGMALVCFAIVGAFITMSSKSFRPYGGYVFAAGFTFSGLMFVWAMVLSIKSDQEGASLQAVKQAVFGALLLITGIPSLKNLVWPRQLTPIYQSGMVGPHGFVPWSAAERLELVESHLGPNLEVGVYGGWTFVIDVPDERRDDITALIRRISAAH